MKRRSFFTNITGLSGLSLLPIQFSWVNKVYANTAPKRLINIFVSQGAPAENFYPASATAALPRMTAPFERYRDRIQLIKGVNLRNQAGNIVGGHNGGSTHMNVYTANSGGDTLDYRIRDLVGGNYVIDPLVLGMKIPGTDGALNLSRYKNTGIAYETNPLTAFDRVFNSSTQTPIELRRKQSVLDAALGDLNRLTKRLGSLESIKLEQHAEAIRRTEQQLIAASEIEGQFCTSPTWNNQGYQGNGSQPSDHSVVSSLQMDLIVLAMQCDMVPIATFALFPEKNGNIPQVSDRDYHDGVVHGGPMSGWIDYWAYFSEKIVELMDKLSATEDIDGGSLLDNTLIYLTSNFGNGQYHAHEDVPTLLAGGENLGNRVGHFAELNNQTQSNMYDTVMSLMGINSLETNGFGTGAISDLIN